MNKMKTLQVPKQDFLRHENHFDKIKVLQESGAEAAIDQVNWKNDFPKTMPVTVQVAHDGERFYLLKFPLFLTM